MTFKPPHILRVVLPILLLCNAGHAAAEDTPVTYQKERLVLHPNVPTGDDFVNGVLLEVDVQTVGNNHNPDWLQLSGYKAGTGLLEIYPASQPLQIKPNRMMAPVDVIAINAQGDVVMIAPNIALSNLTQDITRSELISAILYTQTGLAETIGLQIGDDVEYKRFKKPPLVVDSKRVEHPEEGATSEQSTTPTQTPQKPSAEMPEDANSNLQTKPAAEVPTQGLLQEEAADTKTTSNRRRPIANPVSQGAAVNNAKPEAETTPQLLDTILKRHHQPIGN